MEIHRAGIFNNKLLHSLSTIQAAKAHLRLLTTSNSTPAVLVSQIGLCDVLLVEIHAIRSSLEGRLRRQAQDGEDAVAAKRNRSPGRSVVQQAARKVARDREDSRVACEGLVITSGKAPR
jgi:acetolactate synthase regulatory subunit